MGLLHRGGPDPRDPQLEVLPLVGGVVAGPGALHQLDGLEHALALAVGAHAEGDVFVLVEGGAAPDADREPAVEQVVEQARLDQEPRRVMDRHLHHGEADADAARPLRERGPEDDRIGVAALSGEVVLGEPGVVEAQRLGGLDLPQLLLDHPAVVGGARGERQVEGPEAHRLLLVVCRAARGPGHARPAGRSLHEDSPPPHPEPAARRAAGSGARPRPGGPRGGRWRCRRRPPRRPPSRPRRGSAPVRPSSRGSRRGPRCSPPTTRCA